MPDISRLVVEIDAKGVTAFNHNMEDAAKYMNLSEKEAAKMEKAIKSSKGAIDSASAAIKEYERQLSVMNQHQSAFDKIWNSMQKGGSTSTIDNAIKQYISLDDEVQKLISQYGDLDNAMRQVGNDKALTQIMNEYEQKSKNATAATSLFGETLEILKQKQDLAKDALIQMVASGINPASQKVEKMRNEYQRLTQQIEKTEKSQNDLAQKLGAFQLIANKLPGPLKSIASGLMGLVNPATAVVSALLEIGEAAVKYVKESLAAFSKYESIKTSIEIVSSSAEQASKTFNDLQKFAGRTPFKMEQLSETATLLRQAGINAKDLIPTLEMLGNVSRGSSDNFARIALNFAQTAQTGKATAMDMRQFMLAGVPIRKMLDDIGKSGSTAYEDIAEAIKAATREGGQFEGAMEKGAQTLAGTKQIVENLKEQHKALWAEYNNIVGIKKEFTEYQKEQLENNIAIMRAEMELQEIRKRRSEGTSSFLDDYREAELILETLNHFKDRVFLGIVNADQDLLKILSGYNRQKDAMSGLIETYTPLIEAHNEIIRAQEKYNAMLEESEQGYRKLQTKIEEYYAKTTEGQKEAIENEIKWWRAEQQRTRYEDIMVYDGSALRSIGKREVGITSDETRKIEVIIKMLTESLDKAENKLTSWQKIFKSSMNLSDSDTKQDWFKTQTASINRFNQMLNTSQERARVLADTIGIDFADSIENAADIWERLASEMIMSGEWQADNQLFQQVVQNAKDARDAFNEVNLDKYISSLNTELGMLRMTSSEMEKQKLITEYNVTNENKINQALELQNRLRNGQNRLSTISKITGIAEDDLRDLSMSGIGFDISRNVNKDTWELDHLKKMGIIDADEYVAGLERVADRLKEMNIAFRDTENVKAMTEGWQPRYINVEDEYGMAYQIPDPSDSFQNFLEELRKLMFAAKTEAKFADLEKQLEDAGKSTYELAVERLAIEMDISKEAAQEAIDTKKKIDYITNGYDYMGEISTYIDDVLKSIRNSIKNGEKVTREQYGQYAEGRFSQAGMNLIQGSDAGNFVQGMEMGGPIVGLLNMLAGALEKVLGGMEGLDIILSPITGLLMELSDVIKAFMLPLLVVSKLIVALGTAINWVLNFITFGLFKEMADTYDLLAGTNDERRNEEERLRALNEQYAKLYGALKEQEEYYLQQRRHLNAEWAIEQYQTTPVNDMILSPHGAFSTDPEDYIIATKHPESLMGGGSANVQVTVINNANATVSTQEKTNANGIKEIQVIVDGIVQQGFASGKYDGAMDSVSQRRNGKRIHA